MTNTNESLGLQEIEEILNGAYFAIPMSDLSCIERCYQLRYNKPLDYTSFGATNIQELVFKLGEQNKVLLLENPESKETYVMSVSLAELKQQDDLKLIIEELLDKYGGEIAFTSFQDIYKDTFKVEWNSLEYGLRDLDELCHVLKDIVTMEVNSEGYRVMKAVNKDSSGQAAVIREIEEIFESYSYGIPMSDLSCIEGSYLIRYDKPLDYESFGVENIEELFFELRNQNKVLFLNRTESEDIYVLSKTQVELSQDYLKSSVKRLLRKYDGGIPLSSFKDIYNENHKREWNSYNFGLTDLDQLCHVLKDIVMVEVNSSGNKVMKLRQGREMNEKIRGFSVI